jgi:MYXO-CTERM domain-containing protein
LFVDEATADYHLQASSPAIDQGVDLGYVGDLDEHPVPQGAAPDLGAYEWGNAVGGAGNGGGGAGTGGSTGGAGGGVAGGSPSGGAGGATPPASTADEESGCGCRVPAPGPARPARLLGLLALVGAVWRVLRRRGHARFPAA